MAKSQNSGPAGTSGNTNGRHLQESLNPTLAETRWVDRAGGPKGPRSMPHPGRATKIIKRSGTPQEVRGQNITRHRGSQVTTGRQQPMAGPPEKLGLGGGKGQGLQSGCHEPQELTNLSLAAPTPHGGSDPPNHPKRKNHLA